jgi:transcriptional regulator with XRE-family HTH domain
MDMFFLIDKAKRDSGCESDSQLADALKTTRASVCNWRKGRNFPDAVACNKIAEITGVPLAKVLGVIGEARAISREEKAVWRKLANAAALAGLMLYSMPSQASVRSTLTERTYMHYAK